MAAKTSREWEDHVKDLLKIELKRRKITYAELVVRLAEIGVVESERNIRNKISRGRFSAVFLLQCLQAIGVKDLQI